MSGVVTLTPEDLGNLIIREAGRFVGLREVKPNADWDNPKTPEPDTHLVVKLRELMRPGPWEPGWAYCAAFAEGMVRAAFKRAFITDAEAAEVYELLTPGVLRTFENFKQRRLIFANPVVGSIWLARHGGTEQGHAGIVTSASIAGQQMATIEANTSLDSKDPAKDREGDWITTRNFSSRGRGDLKTLGFITPTTLLKLLKPAH